MANNLPWSPEGKFDNTVDFLRGKSEEFLCDSHLVMREMWEGNSHLAMMEMWKGNSETVVPTLPLGQGNPLREMCLQFRFVGYEKLGFCCPQKRREERNPTWDIPPVTKRTLKVWLRGEVGGLCGKWVELRTESLEEKKDLACHHMKMKPPPKLIGLHTLSKKKKTKIAVSLERTCIFLEVLCRC